ncbi:MAG: LysM peptidoglycan-binding domain-containing protein [Flavobacteriales bacterium]|nr:LysM peptidoglycan-binding domain-containing protein [Flavobacteriales bacterium]
MNGNKVAGHNWAGLLTALCTIFWGFVCAQKPVQMPEGWFLWHEVKKGETLNKISRDYQVPMEKIIFFNPGSDKVIRAGEKIRIPVKAPAEQQIHSQNGKDPKTPKTELTHTVKKGETLFSIARRYGITLQALMAVNPGLTENIREGQVLRLPLNSVPESPLPLKENQPPPITESKKTEGNTEIRLSNEKAATQKELPEDEELEERSFGKNPNAVQCTPKPSSGPFQIAVLLPLDGESADTALRHARIAWQFYCGLQAAAKLHVPRSATFEVRIYDTGPSTAVIPVQNLIHSGTLKDAQVIIGPLYAAAFRPVAEYASKLGIPVLNPFGKSPPQVSEPPQIRITPAQASYVESLARYLALKYQFGRILFVNGAPGRDTAFVRALGEATEKALQKVRPTGKVFYRVNSVQEIGSALDPSSENLIYYPSTRETAVNSFLNQLRALQKNIPLAVLGDESWLAFSTADLDFFSQVRLRIPVQNFVTRGDTLFDRFYNFCQKEFGTEPDFYAFRAYDILCYVMDVLENYGHLTAECLEKESRRYLLSPIKLQRIPGTEVWENKGISVLTLMHNDLFFETFGD